MYPSIPNTKPLSHTIAPAIGAGDPLPDTLTSPPPPTENSKSIWAFWATGLSTLPPYLLRNVLNWHRRFSPLGWTIYVCDTVPNSPLNVSNYIDVSSPLVVPDVFRTSGVSGTYSAQHTSDLIRYPLLLKYGGAYMDVGILQFGDLDWLWTSHLANPHSPYDFAGFCMGDPPALSIVNFSMACGAHNPLVARAHRILLELWRGKADTAGMHAHPLVSHVPLLMVPPEVAFDPETGKAGITDESMTDYAIQIQAMGSAQRWVDEEEAWDGPMYVKEKAWLYTMINGAFAPDQLTAWNGQRQYELMAKTLPRPGEEEDEEQKLAREIVETVVGKSWCLKLAHGVTAKLFGVDTMGMFWKRDDGSDCVEGTYAGWLRWAEVNLQHVDPPTPVKVPVYEPTMKGRLPI